MWIRREPTVTTREARRTINRKSMQQNGAINCLTSDSPVIPGPNHGGADSFDQVLNLVEDTAEGLLRHVNPRVE